MAAKRAVANTENPTNFSPQWSQSLLECHLLQKMENSRHDLLIVALWCHWPRPPEISMSCLFLDLNAKGIETSGKIKRELKMVLCKHQDNCEREMKVLGRRSKGIIASGLAGTRINWPNQCWQIGTYGKRKQCFQHHQSIHKPAPPDVLKQYSYLDFINEEVNGWSMWGKSGLRFSWRKRGPAWLNSLQMKALSNLGLWSQRIKKNLRQGWWDSV